MRGGGCHRPMDQGRFYTGVDVFHLESRVNLGGEGEGAGYKFLHGEGCISSAKVRKRDMRIHRKHGANPELDASPRAIILWLARIIRGANII